MIKRAFFIKENGPSAVHCRRQALVPFLIFDHFQLKISRSFVWRGAGKFASGVFIFSHQRPRSTRHRLLWKVLQFFNKTRYLNISNIFRRFPYRTERKIGDFGSLSELNKKNEKTSKLGENFSKSRRKNRRGA